MSMKFQVLEIDTSIYIRDDIILTVYVNDILIASFFIEFCNAVINELFNHIEIINKGEIKSFLSLNVIRNFQQHTISINQPDYIDYLLAKYNIMNVKSVFTSSASDIKLKAITQYDTFCNIELYQKLTDFLNHLIVFFRSEIIFIVFKLFKFNANSKMTHFKATFHVLRYLKRTHNYCIVYHKSTISIDIIYFDSDFASDENN